MTSRLPRLRPDPYVVALLATAALAASLPARGGYAVGLDRAVAVAIGLLFFLYGARLPRGATSAGVRHWRLHGAVLLSTFALFPALGLACSVLVPAVLPEPLHLGLLFLCALPSTVQSSITFTSIAGGNVAAAICAASFSNLLGVLLTPLLAGMLVAGATGGFPLHALPEIVLLLLVPYLLGQLLRSRIGGWVQRNSAVLGRLDRGVILCVVYAAFSEGTAHGIWHQLTPVRLGVLLVVCAVLLAVVLALTGLAGRLLGFDRPDRIVLVFCGSKKSLASGLPMAALLFAGPGSGLMVLPLMLYHQLQLITCAWLARRLAAAHPAPTADVAASRS